jgi:hypothetical protein
MVARLDDFDGFLGRDCLILFLHKHGYCSFNLKTAARGQNGKTGNYGVSF